MNIQEVAELLDNKGRLGILKVTPEQKVKYQSSCQDERYRQSNFKSPSFTVRVEMSSPDESLLKKVQKTLKVGKIIKVKGSNSFTYMAWSRKGRTVLDLTLPYMKSKEKQAKLLVKLSDLQASSHRGRGGLAPETIQKMEDIYNSLKELKGKA